MFHLVKRVIKWGNRTVTIYIGPAGNNAKQGPKVKDIGLKVISFAVAVFLWWYVRNYG